MTNSRKCFAGDLTQWFLEAGFIQYQFYISIYYNYAPDGTSIFVLYYDDDFVYWYTSEDLGKWFVETLGNKSHANFLGYTHLFIS